MPNNSKCYFSIYYKTFAWITDFIVNSAANNVFDEVDAKNLNWTEQGLLDIVTLLNTQTFTTLAAKIF